MIGVILIPALILYCVKRSEKFASNCGSQMNVFDKKRKGVLQFDADHQ